MCIRDRDVPAGSVLEDIARAAGGVLSDAGAKVKEVAVSYTHLDVYKRQLPTWPGRRRPRKRWRRSWISCTIRINTAAWAP